MKIAFTITTSGQITEDKWLATKHTKVFDRNNSVGDIIEWASKFNKANPLFGIEISKVED